MKLKSLGIRGFRGIRTLELEFPEQINVLVGVNGAGKTAILDCTAIMLSRLIGRIRSSSGNRILEDIMDVPARPREVKERLTDLFVAIEEGKTKKAKRLLSDMRKRIGTDPDLVKASVLIQRREALEE